MGAASVVDSWRMTGLFVLACGLNLVLVDPRTVQPWYSLALAGLVIVFVLAAGLSSALLALGAMVGFVLLVVVGLVARSSRARRVDRGN